HRQDHDELRRHRSRARRPGVPHERQQLRVPRQAGFYDGWQLFRVSLSPSLVQTGDPQNTGEGTAGYFTVVEYTKGDSYPAGRVIWAKGVGTQSGNAGSQFMITTDKVTVKKGVGGDRYGELGSVLGSEQTLQKI